MKNTHVEEYVFLDMLTVNSGYSNFIHEMMFFIYLIHWILCFFLHSLHIRNVIVLFMWVVIEVHVSIKTLRVGMGVYTDMNRFF